MQFQQDNARAYEAQVTLEHFEDENICLIRQPPYSPDHNLCDRYIFPRLESLRDRFDSPDDISAFLDEHLPHFTRNRMVISWKRCGKNRRKRRMLF